MLSKALHKALNDQINHEIYSSYLYLSMAAHCESTGLAGFAQWLKVQSQEEYGHGMKFYAYLHDRNAKVTLLPIDQPPTEFKSPLEMFKQVLDHEKKVTGLIHKLYDIAVKENEYPTQVMLQWFVNEQVEEEKTAGAILEQLKMLGDSPVSLIMMDRQLGARASK